MYTTIEEVKAKLARVRDNNHIRFRENGVENIVAKRNSDRRGEYNEAIIIDYEAIMIEETWQGILGVEFRFTSPTEFNVFKISSRTDKRALNIGASDIASDFSIENDQITFPANMISGAPIAGDTILFEFLVHISDEIIDEYIYQTGVVINAKLNEMQLSYTGDEDELNVVATYLTAYRIYTDIFYDQYCTSDGCQKFIKGWKDFIDDLLDSFVVAKSKMTTNAPSVLSRSPIIKKFGIPGVGRGMTGYTRDASVRNKDDGCEEHFWEFGDEGQS